MQGRSRIEEPKALAVVFAALILAAPTLAAEPEAKEEDAARSDAPTALFLGDVVVTAQKREEKLHELPVAATVFSGTDLEAAAVADPEDLFALVPNLTLGNSFTVSNGYVTARGLTEVSNVDPAMAVIVDDVPLSDSRQLFRELFEVERIEVLKGPQGSIWGRNALGGVIHIVTREPRAEPGGFARAGLGNGGAFSLAGSVSGALSRGGPRWLVAASLKDRDGLIDNAFLGKKADPYRDATYRLRTTAEPAEGWRLDLRLQHATTEGGAVLYALLPAGHGSEHADVPPDESFLGSSERDMLDLSLKVDRHAPGWTLSAITAHTSLEEVFHGDADLSNPVRFPGHTQVAQGQDLDLELWSQEVRAISDSDTSRGDDRRWLAGASMLRTRLGRLFQVFTDTDGTRAGLLPLLAFGGDDRNTTWAVFGQLDVALGDHWRVSGGLRFDRDERRQTRLEGGERRAVFEDLQPRLALSYRSAAGGIVYLSWAGGFRSGGFNPLPLGPEGFREEAADSLELGFKSTLAGGRLRFNAAAYRTEVDGFQYFVVDAATGAPAVANLNRVEMNGLELDLMARLHRHWDGFVAIGLNDASIEDFDGTAAFRGNQSPNNVRSTVNLGIRFSAPLSERWWVSSRADAELRGPQYWHPDNFDRQDAFGLVHGRVSVESRGWSLSLWGKNLTGESFWAEYVDAAWSGLASGLDFAHPGRPRTVGFEVSYSF